MGEWRLGSGFRSETWGATSGGSTHGGTTITGGATANTKGSWTEIASATNFEASAVMVNLDTQFTDTNYLVDIGVGAAGSEKVLIPDLCIAVSAGKVITPIIPVAIPAGSRIAARCADNFGSSTMYVSVSIYSDGFVNSPPFQNVTAYGVVTAGSTGTTVDAGATANTKGSYTQITSSTTRDHRGLMLASLRPVMSVSPAGGYVQITDVAVGASGSEQAIIQNLRYQAQNDAGATNPKSTLEPAFLVFPACDIPAGSRIAIRQQSTSTDAQDRTAAYVVYGLG